MQPSEALALAAGGAGLGWYLNARRRRPAWAAGAGELRRAGPLAVRTLGDGDAAVVLLHGLVGSGRFWGAAYDELGAGAMLVVPDLLGFGRSERAPRGYGPDDHAAALVACFDALGIHGLVVVGAHSLGCVIGLRLATLWPDRVSAVVGFGPPVYPDEAAARRRVGASSPMARLIVLPGPLAERTCRWVCDHRNLAASVAQILHPDVPPAIARDAVQHTWASYSETMRRCLLDAPGAGWLAELRCPVRLVAGEADPVVDQDHLRRLANANPLVSLERWPGDHRLPLTASDRCRAAIVSAVAPSRSAGATSG